jgi:HTH-type transcriptional regulator/antitoxin HigA
MRRPFGEKEHVMDIKPIRTRSDCKAAWKAVDSPMTARRNTPEGDRLDVLATPVEAYERKHFPMDLPDAVEAITFRMERQSLTPKGLEPLIGRSNRVYEILNRKLGLTPAMIQKLHLHRGIPAESLIKQAEAAA